MTRNYSLEKHDGGGTGGEGGTGGGSALTPNDAEQLRQKYKEEREKRVRYTQERGGVRQYQAIDGRFQHMLNDPYVTEKLQRDAVRERCDVLIIGGGYGAQLMAVRLLEAKITNFMMVEKGSDFGGTWYWNRYPGAQCDIESYVYMPLLEETQYIPTRKYTGGDELLRHAQAIGRRYGLYDKTFFQTEVTSLHWNESVSRWDAHTGVGDVFSARYVIPCAGPLHRPKLPGVPGIETFGGHFFHTSRWDYEYTGGSPTSPELSLLKDKRVGVIGTGATAVQIVPHLGKWAKQLYVFQRTPSSVDFRGNCPTDIEWSKTLQPGWQKHRMNNFNSIINGGTEEEDLVADGWTNIIRNLVSKPTQNGERRDGEAAEKGDDDQRQLQDFAQMQQIRTRIDNTVLDPQTAASLKPWYNQFCKRPCFHDDYLPTFNLPNVHLIDTDGKGIDAITPTGIQSNGTDIPLDCIVFATGFDVSSPWSHRAGIDIHGRNNATLSDKFAAQNGGPATFHGYSTRGFPNLFIMSNMQAGLSANFLHMTGFQAEHIAYVIRRCEELGGGVAVEPEQDAEDGWVEEVVRSRRRNRRGRMECTPSYLNNEGESSEALERGGSYGGGALEFMRILTEWREEGSLRGLELGK